MSLWVHRSSSLLLRQPSIQLPVPVVQQRQRLLQCLHHHRLCSQKTLKLSSLPVHISQHHRDDTTTTKTVAGEIPSTKMTTKKENEQEPPPPPPPPQAQAQAPQAQAPRPVIIVGGGPVGLFLSILLSDYQVPHILLERQSVTARFRHPQAHFINTRSMELFRTISPVDIIPTTSSATTAVTAAGTTTAGTTAAGTTAATTSSLYERIQNAMAPVRHWQSFRYGTSIHDRNPLAEIRHPVDRPLQSNGDANGILLQPPLPLPPPQLQLPPRSSTAAVATTTATVGDSLFQNHPTTNNNNSNYSEYDLSPCTVGHLAQHTLGRILYDTAIEKCAQQQQHHNHRHHHHHHSFETTAQQQRPNATQPGEGSIPSQILFDTSVEHIEWTVDDGHDNIKQSSSTDTPPPPLLRIVTKQHQPLDGQQHNNNNSNQAENVYYSDLVIAADGAHSTIRQQLWPDNNRKHTTGRHRQQQQSDSATDNIEEFDRQQEQHLINIHLTIPLSIAHEIHTKQDNYAMLYSVYTSDVIAMIVCHTIGEYVLQIPYFPPYQTIEYDFTHQKVLSYIDTIFDYPNISQQCTIHSIAPWTMKSWIAQHYYQLPPPPPSSPSQRQRNQPRKQAVDAIAGVVVVGDAAHVFPPAGGFGMNTGLQDVHNLAWKIAANRHCQSSSTTRTTTSVSKDDTWSIQRVLQSYQQERRPIAQQNAALSVRNYERLLEVTKTLYLNAQHPALLCTLLDHSPLPLSTRQDIFRTLLKTALFPLSWLRSGTATTNENSSSNWLSYTNHLRRNLRQILQTGAGLPLLFPRYELGFTYHTEASTDSMMFSSVIVNDTLPEEPRLVVGRLVPHVRVHVICGNEAMFPNLKLLHNDKEVSSSSNIRPSSHLISLTDLPAQMKHQTESLPSFVLLYIPSKSGTSSVSQCVKLCHIISNRIRGMPVKFVFVVSDDMTQNNVDEIQSTIDTTEHSQYLILSNSTSVRQAFSVVAASNNPISELFCKYVLIRPDGHISGIVTIPPPTEKHHLADPTSMVDQLLQKMY